MDKSKRSSSNKSAATKSSTISRYISFFMLCVTIVVCGFFFYNVIKGFLLPLFLASLLVVIFRPFHEWVSLRVKGRPTIAAAMSTAAIMLMVLVPLSGLIALGLYEANQVIRGRHKYIGKLEEVRRSTGLQKPFYDRLNSIETELRKLDDAFTQATNADEPFLEEFVDSSRDSIDEQLELLRKDAKDAAVHLYGDMLNAMDEEGATNSQDVGKQLEKLYRSNPTSADLEEFYSAGDDNKLLYGLYVLKESLPGHEKRREKRHEGRHAQDPEKASLRYTITRASSREESLEGLVGGFQAALAAIPTDKGQPTTLELRRKFTEAQVEYDELHTTLLGGPIWKWAIDLVNPSEAQIDEWVLKLLFSGGATRWLPSITSTATSLITGLLVGLAIMSVALFYFFMDGPKMINAFMHLSPLDDQHELELLQEFDKVSRAVVLATLLSAVAQGILGGIGYRIAGLDSIFLLTLLTTFLALIPFVGAAAVWVPCCLYVAFIKEPAVPDAPRTWLYAQAGFLAVYGVLVISMADNLIKPWVLQGQSKLHPLLALLSVLGGVQALGPIGILVGPMVVAFLQVLLTILQREIRSLDAELQTAEE